MTEEAPRADGESQFPPTAFLSQTQTRHYLWRFFETIIWLMTDFSVSRAFSNVPDSGYERFHPSHTH
jgi:hypothetical protein